MCSIKKLQVILTLETNLVLKVKHLAPRQADDKVLALQDIVEEGLVVLVSMNTCS